MKPNDLQYNFRDAPFSPSILSHSGHSQSGIRIECATAAELDIACREFQHQLAAHSLEHYVDRQLSNEKHLHIASFSLDADWGNTCTRENDTLQLCQQLNLDTRGNLADLEREILLAMLLSPAPFNFPSHGELASAVRIRKNVVVAARKTQLDFHTTAIERPAEYWVYDENRGFTLIPGKPLIEALKKATQPDESGKQYSFSCYRATEYIILLAVAQELESCNPALYQTLQQQWESKAIMSESFHTAFMRELGSMENPLPPKFYIPGDRLWFRNPDEHSSDVAGYEGSWVFYLGDGLFSNFWKPDSAYTLTDKCLEIYHWRNATYRDMDGELQINEGIVEERVRASLKNKAEVDSIMQQMMRFREAADIYVDGGCIDTTREYPRCVCPGTAEISLPKA